jgi:hypothetical protein
MRVVRTVAGRFGLLLFAVVVVALAGLEALATHRSAATDAKIARRERAQRVEPAPWSAALQVVDRAIRDRDLVTADRELQSTYLAALGSRRWEGMIAYGDAVVRMADIATVRHPWVEKARQAYLIALFRARDAGSVDGVLQAAEGFHRLKDREVTELALRVAERMTRGKSQVGAERLHDLAARLDASQVIAEPTYDPR